MNYPFWDVGIGYGILMAAIAVIHVFISHFAIGGGLYLVVSETVARRRNDGVMLEFLQKLTRFFVLVTLVAGALTGVGIWFIIGLLNPAATEVLIHNFVWGWAIEWTFFLIEIAAAIIYLYGWNRMSPKNHLRVGWLYFLGAWLSLAIINGIVTFMLTPGRWLQTGAFWDGFFNPTYWPSLVMRTGVCVMLAGLYTMMVASRVESAPDKARLTRYSAVWGLAGLALTMPAFFWYYRAIPAAIIERASTMFWPAASLAQSYRYAAVIAVMLMVFGLIASRWNHTAISLVIMLFGLAWFGSFEWFRESVRKPYVIDGYIYANAVDLANLEHYRTDGYLMHMPYRTGDDGADLFRRACGSCHTLGGSYRNIAPAFAGTDAEFVAGMIRGAHRAVGSMPQFLGRPEEVQALDRYIWSRVDQRPLAEIYGLEGIALGEKVYEIRCGNCHVLGGHNDKWESLAGMTKSEYLDLFQFLGDISEEMPPLNAPRAEQEALAEYLESLNGGGSDATPGL